MKISRWKTELIFGAVALMMLLGFSLFVLSSRSASLGAARVGSYTSFSESVAAFKRDPNDPAALRGMADHCMLRHDYLKAVFYLRQAVKVEPANTFNKFRLGIALKQAGQKEEAIRVLEEVAATGGDNPEKEAAGKIAEKMKSRP